MSDLWMILVLLGVSIVLAVVVFNWWQEKKYRRDVEYRFSHTRGDVLDSDASSANTSDTAHVDSLKKEPLKKANTEKNVVSEDVEGWMSEPRVRQSAKVEPDFTVGESAKAKINAATSASFDKNGLNLNKQPAEPTLSASSIVTPAKAASAKAEPFKVEPAKFESTVKAEPVISAKPEVSAPVAQSFDDIQQPAFEQPTLDFPEEASVEDDSAHIEESELPAAVHPSMDWVGLIDAPLGVMLAELEDMQAEVRTFPQHATLWAQSSTTGDWQDVLALDAKALQDQTPASQVACSLQLADRGGPVDEETLKRFQKSMETLARALGLTVHWQGGYEPSVQSQSIDAFCIEVDKAVEFHVLANQGMFHATKLRGLAEACGMQLSVDGRFELFNTEGQLEFSVRNYEGKPFSADMLKTAVMTGVTFQLDIPTTPNSLRVFDHMVDIAASMASSLSGSMIDVNRKAIGDAQLDKIRQQLKNISNAMAAQGITPGSSHAKRLFS
jgi:FtsZ-interacting cell division protein ZipA